MPARGKRTQMDRNALLALVMLAAVTLGRPGPARAQTCAANVPHVTGTWVTLPYLMPINPISATLMHTGKILIVAGSENDPDNYSPGAESYRNAVWDPTGTDESSITVQNVPYDVFCSGTAVLPDGRALVVGGTSSYAFTGDNRASIFNPATEDFVQSQDMADGRWYATATTLGDGRIMAFSGLDPKGGVNSSVEIYSLTDAGAGCSYTDTGVTNGTTYYYVVAGAYTGDPDAGGGSASSPEASATPQQLPLRSIAVTPSSPSLTVGATQQFTATGTYSDGSTQNLTSQVTWGSSNTTTATINSSALATAMAAGSTTISATLGAVSGSTGLTVTPGPLTITTAALPAATSGVAYSATLTATGGTPPYTWSIASGTLPAGLTLTTGGVISGTPTATGTSSFTVKVTAGSQNVTKALGITVNPSTTMIWPTNPTPAIVDGGDPAA